MLNPLTYTEKVVRSFLRYQMTAYPFADDRLNAQMRTLLSLDQTRRTPLLKGPYISLSRAFRFGSDEERLASEGVLHPHMRTVIPYPRLYGHQEDAIRAIRQRRTTLISTGTGSGKSECYLYPIISRCLELRDQKAPPGICAVLIYPMNALAEDQLGRLRELLAGTGIRFGMYVGKTPEKESDVTGQRLEPGSSAADYRKALQQSRESGHGASIHPAEEVCSREAMRTAGDRPRILLTNVKQMELLLTRHLDIELFDQASLDYLVCDEAHTYSGAEGAETACLLRRLRSFCGRSADQTTCIATSATIVDPADPDAARHFASRFFGVPDTDVLMVSESYEADAWAAERQAPPAIPQALLFLEDVRKAVEEGDAAIRKTWKKHLGGELPAGDWESALFDVLSSNEFLYQASEFLLVPLALSDLVERLSASLHRPVSDEETIAWLILGASARKDGRPLVRPVVHAFIRGIAGAVVTFKEGSAEPILHLSAEDEEPGDEKRLKLRVSTCTICGQHYFEHHLADFTFTEEMPGGGKIQGSKVYWEPTDPSHGGQRVFLTDRLISWEDGDEADEHEKLVTVHLCRSCGAAHREAGERCLACGVAEAFLSLSAVQQKTDREGCLASCVCCGALGRSYAGRFRDAAKSVRAVNVADIHVLTQDMIHHAERKRLLVFADNRQDAAFQAGWMRDHARRFRLRALMAKCLISSPRTIGDLVYELDQRIAQDSTLSSALLPEVWQAVPDENSMEHQKERQHFLRLQILLELTMASRQRIGLEPWGRLKVSYKGLNENEPFFQSWARTLRIPADELVGGVAALLDELRRKRILHDEGTAIFERILKDGSRELLNGYVPEMRGVPKGVKLNRAPADDRGRVTQWISPGHSTQASQVAQKWGVEEDEVEGFLRDLWAMLVEREILKGVTLKGSRGRPLPNCHGVYQVNGGVMELAGSTAGLYRCRTCRRSTVRRTPHMKCMAWRCAGELEHIPEDPDNYDLQLVDNDYTLLRPREHTAMVPTAEREALENIFKGESDAVNALVCTQTLEMGVDIGSLDAILMRNVPPLASNYWQRAGRAGRRHRMAVNLTYCRMVSHDRAYFSEPLKMLAGHVEPPRFNLANDLMVAKHVHATVVTILHQLSRPGSALPESERKDIASTLKMAFPAFIRDYLFAENDVRPAPLDVSHLRTVIERHKSEIEKGVSAAFMEGWPREDAAVVSGERLFGHIGMMVGELESVIRRLHQRLKWVLRQMQRLQDIRANTGTLNEDQQSFYDRCDHFVKRMKGQCTRYTRREAEGVDDTLTMSVLGAEGFLPGYGLETGSIVGYAVVPKWVRGLMDFDLPRTPSVALREYVPGNLIYANGQRFVPRNYIRQIEDADNEKIVFSVDMQRESVVQVDAAARSDNAAQFISAIPICDVSLVHWSRIADEEENRFQMGVSIFGREIGQHNGGKAYRWGPRALMYRRGVRIQLVNVGAPSVFKARQNLGYQVCAVCGQSVSPFSSERQREEFQKTHADMCGQKPESTGFYANLSVNTLSLHGCASRTEAYSIMEGLRFAAADQLTMDLEDLQVLVIGQPDRDDCDAYLYDPMPGGSGLLDQLCEQFSKIALRVSEMATDCPGRCVASCIDCFQTYRNAAYHKHLDRTMLSERIREWGTAADFEHDIPPKQPAVTPSGDERPVNEAERKLRLLLLGAGFPEGRWQELHPLPRPFSATMPDVTYDDPSDSDFRIFIYLDGLSRHIHGNPETQQRDMLIRNQLRADGHNVLEIPVSHLDDKKCMVRHFKRLAQWLDGRDRAIEIERTSENWFKSPASVGAPGAGQQERPFQVVAPKPHERWVSCVPLTTLKVAAGGFSEDQSGFEMKLEQSEEWVSWTGGGPFKPGMFVAQVSGKSMEPRIPDGSYCLFGPPAAGTRKERIVLVWHEGQMDPETGGQYTVKVFESDKDLTAAGHWNHARIKLKPLNSAFRAIELVPSDENRVRVMADFIRVI